MSPPGRPLVAKQGGVRPKRDREGDGYLCALYSVYPLPTQYGRVTLTHPVLMRAGGDTLEGEGFFQ